MLPLNSEIHDAQARRDYYNTLIVMAKNLTEEELVESLILLAFNNEGGPRDFAPKQMRELLQKFGYFQEVLVEGYPRGKVFKNVL